MPFGVGGEELAVRPTRAKVRTDRGRHSYATFTRSLRAAAVTVQQTFMVSSSGESPNIRSSIGWTKLC